MDVVVKLHMAVVTWPPHPPSPPVVKELTTKSPAAQQPPVASFAAHLPLEPTPVSSVAAPVAS